jgi:hypothetical protein
VLDVNNGAAYVAAASEYLAGQLGGQAEWGDVGGGEPAVVAKLPEMLGGEERVDGRDPVAVQREPSMR